MGAGTKQNEQDSFVKEMLRDVTLVVLAGNHSSDVRGFSLRSFRLCEKSSFFPVSKLPPNATRRTVHVYTGGVSWRRLRILIGTHSEGAAD